MEQQPEYKRQLCSATKAANRATEFESTTSCEKSSNRVEKLVTRESSIVVFAIVAYATISLSIIYFNWWLFTRSFKFPVFVSWIQQVIGFSIFIIMGYKGKCLSSPRLGLTFERPKWNVCKKVFPLTFAFVGMVGLANICLQYVRVSTYQVARSLTIFFTIIISYLVLGDTQDISILISCGVLVVGFVVGSLDTQTISFSGVLAGVFSSVFQALYNVNIKSTLPSVNDDPNMLLFYNLFLSSILFIPFIFISGEVVGVFASLVWDCRKTEFYAQWASLFVSGLLATAMNLSAYWCVKVTSPLTFNIVGFTKSILQSAGGILFLGDEYTLQSLTGLTLSLVGSGAYSTIKVKNVDKHEFAKLPPDDSATLEQQQSCSSSSDIELVGFDSGSLDGNLLSKADDDDDDDDDGIVTASTSNTAAVGYSAVVKIQVNC